MNEIIEYLKYNTLEIRDEVIEMVSGQEVEKALSDESFGYVSEIIDSSKRMILHL